MLNKLLKRDAEKSLAPNDRAPDFTLPDQDGRLWTLADLLAGQKAVVLFFYPADETYGCTKEACSFRDSHEVFTDAGARVVGISSDSVSSHARFAGKHRLPYTLLSDKAGKVRESFAVPRPLGFIEGRTTFVLDGQGIVRGVFNSLTQFDRHVHEALALVNDLK